MYWTGLHYKTGDDFDATQIDGELCVKKLIFSLVYAKVIPYCVLRMVYYTDQNNRLWSIQSPCRCRPKVREPNCNSEAKKLQLLPDKEVIELVSYAENTVKLFACVTADEELYLWGHFENLVSATIGADNPTYVETVKPVTQVALGYKHMLVLDIDGNVHVAGRNRYGQIGLGKSTDEKLNLTKLRIGTDRTKVVQVACGQQSSAVLTSSGQVYVFGQLTNESDVHFQPFRVQITNVVEISLSYKHILARTKESKVYAWGWNQLKQCGFSEARGRWEQEPTIKKPQLIKDLLGYNVTKISAGNKHSLVKFIEYETTYTSISKSF